MKVRLTIIAEINQYGLKILKTVLAQRERWVLLKIPRCDIDGVGEVK